MIQVVLVTLVFLLIFLASSSGHVSLTYPPARTYAIDFLDSARTEAPCGVPRGAGPVTNLKSGSTFLISWYLGYAHDGGFHLELIQYDANGVINTTYPLTPGAFIGASNITTTSYVASLPAGFVCASCTIRLVRQALNWGPSYLFWSCADVNILPVQVYSPTCSNHGRYTPATSQCACTRTYSGFDCQFQDECDTDIDCGPHGQCRRITQYSYPQKMCYCQQGWFGYKCEKVSALTSTQFQAENYHHETLSTDSAVELYYRILQSTNEIEVVIEAHTTSFLGIGWKLRGSAACNPYLRPSGAASPEPGVSGSAQPEPGLVYPSTSNPQNGVAVPEPGIPVPVPEGTPVAEPGSASAEPEGGGDLNNMDCTDMVIGMAVGNLSRVHDYYTRDRSTPRVDEFYGGTQSLTAAVGEERPDGTTIIMFRKPITAYEMTDISIINDLMVVIWSHGQTYSDTPNVGDFYRQDELKYHKQHRGVASINFFAPPNSLSNATPKQSWSIPDGCSPDTCLYKATWSLDQKTDIMTFTVNARQPANMWTAIGFATARKMMNVDVIAGSIDNNNKGNVIDGWIGGLYSAPTKDATQNVVNTSISYNNGVINMAFSRQRNTMDAMDWAFTNTDCYYFFFPVGGGPFSATGYGQHSSTPVISDNKICIRTTDPPNKHSPYAGGSSRTAMDAIFFFLIAFVSFLQS